MDRYNQQLNRVLVFAETHGSASDKLAAVEIRQSDRIRYCPHCGTIGELGEGKRCCPDGHGAPYVPRQVAEQAREGFLASIREPDLAGIAGDVLQAMAEVASENGPLSAEEIRESIPMMVQLMMMKKEN